ncbi:MAG: endonuclease/exonuclease/phosphatase family protein [Chitinophagales bacterium]|nr:endonuclease/exonuclease/phosphatase family protein [Chitinophagales bacterium]
MFLDIMVSKIKIGTINLDWCKKPKIFLDNIKESIKSQKFDFIVITENIEDFNFDPSYNTYHTNPIPIEEEYEYLHYGEYLGGKIPVRVSIYTRHKAICKYKVCDPRTSIAYSFYVGNLVFILYGTIIGTYGIKYQKELALKELENFKEDVKYLKAINRNLIIAGDLNTSFINSETHSQLSQINSRKEILDFAQSESLNNTTANIPNNIDHIITTNRISEYYKVEVQEFINSESLKDQYHKGIQIELTQVKDERAY